MPAVGRAVARARRARRSPAPRPARRPRTPAPRPSRRRRPRSPRARRSSSAGSSRWMPGHARVAVHDHLGPEQLGPHLRLAHHRPVRGPAGDDRHQARAPRARRAPPTPAAPARPPRRPARAPRNAARAAASARVTITLPAPPSSSAVAIAAISSGVLPSAMIPSGAPWRASRSVSTRAKPRSTKAGPRSRCRLPYRSTAGTASAEPFGLTALRDNEGEPPGARNLQRDYVQTP